MGIIRTPGKGKLIAAILATDDDLLASSKEFLKRSFGAIDLECEPFPFSFTRYYEGEMGTDLIKQVVSFSELIQKESLADVKHKTNQFEDSFAVDQDGKTARRVNIDPDNTGSGFCRQVQLLKQLLVLPRFDERDSSATQGFDGIESGLVNKLRHPVSGAAQSSRLMATAQNGIEIVSLRNLAPHVKGDPSDRSRQNRYIQFPAQQGCLRSGVIGLMDQPHVEPYGSQAGNV